MSMSLVLFVADSLTQADELTKVSIAAKPKTVQFRYPPAIGVDPADPCNLLTDCQDLIGSDEGSEIDAVISLHTCNDLLASLLPQGNGPEFEGVALTMHEYYNKKLLLDGFNVPFTSVTVEDITMAKLESGLLEVGCPAMVRGAIVCSDQLLINVKTNFATGDLEYVQKKAAQQLERYKPLLEQLGHTHPLLLQPLVIVQADWTQYNHVTHHQIECCISDGELIPWAITDLVFGVVRGDRCFQYVRMPSMLRDNIQVNIWATCGVIAQRLQLYGFNDHFVHLHIVCTDDDQVRVTDLRTGINAANTKLYLHVLNLGNNLKALVDLHLGRGARSPKVLPVRCAVRAELSTMAKDCIASDTLNMKLLKLHPEIDVLCHADTEIKNNKTELAHIYINDTTEASCLSKLAGILEAVCRSGVMYNWPLTTQASR